MNIFLPEELLSAAQKVVSFDWSENDQDAVQAMQHLRMIVELIEQARKIDARRAAEKKGR